MKNEVFSGFFTGLTVLDYSVLINGQQKQKNDPTTEKEKGTKQGQFLVFVFFCLLLL
jgi:hypothetical protein